MKKKRSKALLLAALIGTGCSIYLFSYMGQSAVTATSGTTDSATAMGISIGIAMATPCLALSILATLFAWISFGTRVPGLALTAGILYTVALVLMLPWFMFILVQMILCFVGYSNQKKLNRAEGG